jgi:MerR family transcriptional regulator, heat shock protein HspR
MTARDNKREEPRKYHHISSVSRMYNIHPQTLRIYEREGLLKPSRSEGNTRLYAPEDLKRLEIILNLVRDLGVNLAGVEVILNMRERMEQIESEINSFLDYVRKEFAKDREDEFEAGKKALVLVRKSGLVRIKDEDESS